MKFSMEVFFCDSLAWKIQAKNRAKQYFQQWRLIQMSLTPLNSNPFLESRSRRQQGRQLTSGLGEYQLAPLDMLLLVLFHGHLCCTKWYSLQRPQNELASEEQSLGSQRCIHVMLHLGIHSCISGKCGNSSKSLMSILLSCVLLLLRGARFLFILGLSQRPAHYFHQQKASPGHSHQRALHPQSKLVQRTKGTSDKSGPCKKWASFFAYLQQTAASPVPTSLSITPNSRLPVPGLSFLSQLALGR